METERATAEILRSVRSTLLSAISELDLRGTDAQITRAMCVIEAAFDAAIAGEQIPSVEILNRGLSLATRS